MIKQDLNKYFKFSVYFLTTGLISFILIGSDFKMQHDETIDMNNYDVIHYNLFFDLHPEKKYLIASAEIKAVFTNDKKNCIQLDFYNNFKITEVTVNGEDAEYKYGDQKLIIENPFIKPDTILIKIVYEGTPQRAGFAGFVFGEINDHSLVYTLSEPDYSSSWFPCKDVPNDKALLDVTIENDSSQVSVSNGRLIDMTLDGNRKIYHWKSEYPISTYLIAIYSSGYKTFSDIYISQNGLDTMSIDYYILPENIEEAKIDFTEHVDMMNFFARTFGEYPFLKDKYGVAEFLWQMGAMEHQTITGFASSMIGGRKYFTDVLAHELAHQWWGDAIGLNSWKDIWLNEGFSTYSEALYFEWKAGKSALQSTMRQKHQGRFNGSLANPGAFLFSRTVYDKGAWVLHMLRWQVGDDRFFRILQEYYSEFKYSNASTDDFKRICEKIYGKNLDKFFEQWISSEGEIKLEYEIIPGKGETKIKLEQIQEKYDTYHFPLEIMVNYENGKSERKLFRIRSRKTEISFNNKHKIKEVVLDPDSWLLADFVEKIIDTK